MNKMFRKAIFVAAIATLLVMPASALTLQQAMDEVAGMSCSGSVCTSSVTVQTTVQNPDIVTTVENPDIITTVDNPDIVTSEDVLVSPATESTPRDYSGLATWCPMISTMNGGKTYPTNVNADCVPQSLNPGKGGFPAVYNTVTTVTDGGTSTVVTDGGTSTIVTPGGTSIVETCSTTSKEMVYNGPNTDRANAWTVNTSVSSSDGPC